MGNFAIGQDWTMLCNLHPKRWKIRRIKTASDKNIINLHRELCHLWQVISNMEYEELEVPLQRGYKRHFELKEDVRLGKDADFFQTILNKINAVQYSNDKQFKKIRARRIGKYKYRKRGNPMLLDLTVKQFKTLSEREKLYFYPIETYYPNTKLWVTRYRFAEPWLFELRIRPNMLTKVKKRNWEAERRQEEIENYLITKKNCTKTERTKRTFSWWLDNEWRRRPRQENPLRNKPLHVLMEIYNEEKQL